MTALAAGLASRAAAQPAGGNAMAIDEGLFVDINGMEQWITLRGRDARNPLILILHGGPGFPTSFMAPVFAAWEQDFTVVQWDQPGGGATHSKNLGRDPGPMTIARYLADGVAVAEYLRGRFPANKIVLLGNSWGTLLGVMMIQSRPELFAAYVGASQAADAPAGHRLGYELGLEAARKRGDATAVAALEKVGRPPYARLEDFLVRQTYTNPPGLPPSAAEATAMAAMGKILAVPPPVGAKYIAQGLPPYDFAGQFLEVQRAIFAETGAWRAADHGLSFKVPVFVFQGENDLNTPVATARAWFDSITAPAKAFEVIPGASHNTLAFADELLALVGKHVKPIL
jgi:pimeloyl-ACP methyl ester carboxylesterase